MKQRFSLAYAVPWLLLAFLSVRAAAQNQGKPTADAEEASFRVLNSFGVTTNTNSGIIGGLVFRQAKALTSRERPRFRYLSAELVNVKHPKERAYAASSGNRLILGKQRYLFALRGQWGREMTLFERSDDGGVQFNGILAAGPTLGLLKPYYVQVVNLRGPRQVHEVPYSPELEQSSSVAIVGGGSLFRGFNRIELVPGLNAKIAASIELDAFRHNTIGLEIGFLVEGYTKDIILIPETTNRNVFTSGFLTLYFGQKK
ncbi:MAG: hypothetical protein LH606_02230 [Cytophagaceae bacterium]|nr:hypothetical protein [Cytophagaceae bacterium]